VRVAVDALNASGGINGRKLEVIVEDNRSEPQEAVTVYRKMISSDKVDIFLSGCVSAGNPAAAGIVVRAQIPMVLCSILPQVEDHVKWAFSTLPPAIHEASYWGHESSVRVLLGAKAYVDYPKDNGYTALLSAASRGHLSIVQLLIKSGANVDHQMPIGLTALQLASSVGFNDVVNVLLAAGARPDLKNVRDETHLDVAGRTAELQRALTAATTAEGNSSMLSTSVPASWVSYLIVFSILFVPPAILRLAWRRPLAQTPAKSEGGS